MDIEKKVKIISLEIYSQIEELKLINKEKDNGEIKKIISSLQKTEKKLLKEFDVKFSDKLKNDILIFKNI